MQRLDRRKNRSEAPIFQVGAHVVLGKHGDADAGEHPLVDGLDAAEPNPATEAEPIAAAGSILPISEERNVGRDIEKRVALGVFGSPERIIFEQRGGPAKNGSRQHWRVHAVGDGARIV